MALTDRSAVPAHLRPLPETMSIGGVECDLRDDGSHVCGQAERRPSNLFNVVQQCAVLAFHTHSPADSPLSEIVRAAEELLGLKEQTKTSPLFERAALCYDVLYAKKSPAAQPASWQRLKEAAAGRHVKGVPPLVIITDSKKVGSESRFELSVQRAHCRDEAVKLRCLRSPRDDHLLCQPSTETPGRLSFRGERRLESWRQPTTEMAPLVC